MSAVGGEGCAILTGATFCTCPDCLAMTALLMAAHQRLAADVEAILAKHPAGARIRAMGIAEAEALLGSPRPGPT